MVWAPHSQTQIMRSPPLGVRKGKQMTIDLKKHGLTEESTFEEIQQKLSELEVYDSNELKAAQDAAAAGARKAALANKKGANLSEEELKEWESYKNEKVIKTLKEHEILSKFDSVDADLIIKAEGLDKITDEEELANAISNVSEKYKAKLVKKPAPIPVKNNGVFDDERTKTPEPKIDNDKLSHEIQDAFK